MSDEATATLGPTGPCSIENGNLNNCGPGVPLEESDPAGHACRLDGPTGPVGQVGPPGQEAIDASTAETEKELKRLSEEAEALMGFDGQINQACITMRDGHRMFAVGRAAIFRRLAELNRKDLALANTFVEGMLHASQREFDRLELLNSLQKVTLGFLAYDLKVTADAQQEVIAEADKVEETARKAAGVSIGVTCHPDHDGVVARGDVTVFTGEAADVQRILNGVVENAERQKEPRIACIRLIEAVGKNSLDKDDTKAVEVGSNQWAYSLTTKGDIHRTLKNWFKRTYKNRVDLLIIDNLALAVKPLFEGYSPVSCAYNAQKALRKWAAEMGCAVVAGLPIPAGVVPVDNAEWGGLMEYTDLYRVAALPPSDALSIHSFKRNSTVHVQYAEPEAEEKQEDDNTIASDSGMDEQGAGGCEGESVGNDAGRPAGETESGQGYAGCYGGQGAEAPCECGGEVAQI